MNSILNIFNKMPVLMLLILAALSVSLGDLFAKYWSQNLRAVFFWLAILGYIGSGVFYIPTLLREGLVITSFIWALLSTMGLLFIGLVLFKETLSSVQVVGVILSIVALILLEL